MNDLNSILAELKTKIIETLQLPDVTPEDFKDDDRLVGGELGIDSIDVLELVMMIEEDFGVKIESQEVGEKVFSTLRTLAEFIASKKL